MKKLVTFALIAAIAFASLQPSAINATEIRTEIEYLENGDSIETTIVSTTSAQTLSTSSTVSGTKVTTYKNSSGDKLWSVSVTGTFSYVSGKSCTCTSASGSSATYSSNWKVTDATASKSGNKATATATGTHYLAFLPVGSYDLTVTLTCSTTGTLS